MGLNRCKNGHMYSARKYGDTCPYCNTNQERNNMYSNNKRLMIDDPDKTMSISGAQENVDPVTGWLVCIEGAQYGKDYKVRAGKNFIGRADNMHIQILGDNTISRINHAAIIYDSKNRSTYLLPGDSSGLAYHNGEAVYTPVELSAFSVIEIGQCKFIFIPLCGEHFEWNEGNEEANEMGDM
ncbi:MAG: FHA domain-containing protein [Roseburia sp.]|nr:FHA domain-containing protein [Roseburia sp.]MCM1278653.1 FHA domain-containing protein [Robinsoniella sp.]